MSKYLTRQGLKNFGDNIKSLLGPMVGINDYIVSQGSGSGGSGAKGNNGRAECGGSFYESVSVTSGGGEIYENSNYTNRSFPSGLFNTTPKYCNILFAPNIGTFGLLSMELGTGLSSSRTQNYALTHATGGTLTGYTTIHAIGTGK